MAAVESGQTRAHGKVAKKHKKKRRVGTRIDFTPMVDVAFLLLTFFVYATTMSQPQTMELNLPPDAKTTVEVAESNLMTIRVDPKGQIFWSIGSELPKKVEFKDFRKLLFDRNSSNPKLIVLVKVDRESTYNTMVTIMDQMNLANITRFSLAPMTDADKKILQKATV